MSHVNGWNLASFVGFWATIVLFFGGFIGLPLAVPAVLRRIRRPR